jgi:phage-related baseplate assembly protein
MTDFPRPVFAQPDALAAEQELQAEYTDLTGKTLLPAQPETLLTNWAAYLKTVVETAIQYTGEQCLVNYANDQNLDELGAFWDQQRLPAEPAISTIEFTLSGVQGTDTLISAGTRVRTNDRLYAFATNENLTISAGNLSGQILATATEAGEGGNGYALGTINELVDIIPNVDTALNVTISSSGADIEDDTRYRQRLLLAPNSITVAGTLDQYRFLTLTVDSSIIDVGIETPTSGRRKEIAEGYAKDSAKAILKYLEKEKGVDILETDKEELYPFILPYVSVPRYSVDIYILSDDGGANQDLIDKVQAYYDTGETRPLTDIVRVYAPIIQDQEIEVEVTVLDTADTSTLQARLDQLLADYVKKIESSLGYDIVPSQIADELFSEEIYNINVVKPNKIIEIAFNERPNITSSVVTITGVSER